MISTNTLSIREICENCGAKCCKPSMVSEPFDINLGLGDFTKILEIGAEFLIDTVFDPEEGLRFILKPHIFGYCPFLDYRSNKCKIYSSRPITCKRFPYDPQVKSSIKNQCLLLKSFDSKRLKSIEKHYSRKIVSEDFIEKQRKLDELDALNYSTKYSKTIDSCLDDKRPSSLVHNAFGSFIVKPFLDNDDRTLRSLLRLLQSFKEHINVEKIVINVFVIDQLYQPILELKGILGKDNSTETEIFHGLDSQYNYYEEKFNGPFLEGIFYFEELDKSLDSWSQCWTELSRVLRKS
ncbi:MAG: YkgJ family cysteine cluster protein [Candidatus Hodarchaeales archaeon]